MKEDPSLLALTLIALTYAYPDDALAPGVVLAYLNGKEQFYCAFARYVGENKRRVTASSGHGIDETAAIVEALETWLPVAPATVLASQHDELTARVRAYRMEHAR